MKNAVSIPASRRSGRVSEYTRLKILAANQDCAFGAMDCESSEPKSWKEAIKDCNWMNSMELEYKQLQDLHSWEYKKPDNRKVILRSHWVYKLKADGQQKSRLTIDGREHFVADTYASVATKESLRMLLSYAVTFDKVSTHIDISNAFLYGQLEPHEFVQMRQPEGMSKK